MLSTVNILEYSVIVTQMIFNCFLTHPQKLEDNTGMLQYEHVMPLYGNVTVVKCIFRHEHYIQLLTAELYT